MAVATESTPYSFEGLGSLFTEFSAEFKKQTLKFPTISLTSLKVVDLFFFKAVNVRNRTSQFET